MAYTDKITKQGAPLALSILGGGIAGLSAGHFARKKGLRFRIYEAGETVGGNCRTFEHEGFFYDSGAHRFHDKDPEMTRELRDLLGDELGEIRAPSQICHEGRFIDFPLSPLNLVRKLGAATLTKAAFELVRARLSRRGPRDDFEAFALHTYGRTIAELFLLGYSRKLWGMPPERLSPVISGGRLKGLTISAFLFEAFGGKRKRTRHLDGSFYYPRHGIRVIPERLAESCGRENILTGSRITRVFHDARGIRAVEVNGRERVATGGVINTLPLSVFVGLLDPVPPPEVLASAGRLGFRDLVLIALFLDRPSLSKNASIYFPDAGLPFARLYEPKNRSRFMAPPDRTAVVVECPCFRDDAVWSAPDGRLVDTVRGHLARLGLIREPEVLGGTVARLEYAYPVIESGTEAKTQEIFGYLERFENLRSSGRVALFEYIHIHDIMRIGQEIVEGMSRVDGGRPLGDPEELEQPLDVHPPFVGVQGEKAAQ
jgi:protoporphyrinogen oxidase